VKKAYRPLVGPVLVLLLLVTTPSGAAQNSRLPGTARVGRIDFRGNHHFSGRALRRMMRLAPTKRLVVFTRHPEFYQDFLRTDLRTIEAAYHSVGFSKAHATFVLKENKDAKPPVVNITVVLYEGPQTRISSITFSGLTITTPDKMQQLMVEKVGDPLNEALFPVDREAIKNYYYERGYIYAQVTPELMQPDSLRAEVRIDIVEGEPKDFGYVTVSDSLDTLQTSHAVIRRNISFRPGQLFQASKLNDSEQRLYDTGLFSDVRFTLPQADSADTSRMVDMRVAVVERKFRYVDVGVEYDASSQLLLTSTGGFRNVSGMNRRLEENTALGLRTRSLVRGGRGHLISSTHFGLTLTEPWFLGQRQEATIGPYYEYKRDPNNDTHRTSQIVATTGVRRDLTRKSHVGAILLNSWVRELGFSSINPADTTARYQSRTLTVSFDGDYRNNFFNPTRGTASQVQLQYAGLGGKTNYTRGTAEESWFRPFGKKLVWAFRVRGGLTHPIVNSYPTGVSRESVELSKVDNFGRFRLGGATTVRAYREGSIGADNLYEYTVKVTTDSTGAVTAMDTTYVPGGLAMLLVNMELRWTLTQRLGFVVFLDGGNVWYVPSDFRRGSLFPSGGTLKPEDMKYDVGLGIRVNTPLGPFRLDYAKKIGLPSRLEPDQDFASGRFVLALGQAF
jgi:outer membrane protein assembly complex protein YaeT